jgi:hypothetical protein
MVTKVGELYVGRQPQYLRGVANIKFAVEQMRNVRPNADYDDLTLVGQVGCCDGSFMPAQNAEKGLWAS